MLLPSSIHLMRIIHDRILPRTTCFPGKSSIFLALFRMVEPESGSVIIDGVDVKTIGLYHLRSKMSIIPQVEIFDFVLHEITDCGRHTNNLFFLDCFSSWRNLCDVPYTPRTPSSTRAPCAATLILWRTTRIQNFGRCAFGQSRSFGVSSLGFMKNIVRSHGPLGS